MNNDVILDNFAHFGDGNTCMVYRYKKFREEDGVLYWEFLLRPGKRIIQTYSLNDEIDPIDNSIRRVYPETEVCITDMSPNHFRAWIFPDFEGNPTQVSMMDDDKDVQILNLQKKINALEIELAEMHQLLRTRASPETYIRQASNLVREARTAAAKMSTGGEGEVNSEEDDY